MSTHNLTNPKMWLDCYGQSWSGIIVPAAFSHPAKFSKALIERIYAHMEKRGWIEVGDVIGDPFGGVGLGGIIGAYRGYRWVGVELERKFCSLARRNFALHQSKWKRLGVPRPVILQGDSRQFARIVGQVAASITSPPYAETGGNGGGGINVNGYVPAPGIKWTGSKPDPVGKRTYQGTAGDRQSDNIETLKLGSLDAVLTSPPWEKNCEGSRKGHKLRDPLKGNRGHGASDAAVLAQASRDEQKVYGESLGNIGNTEKQSYWSSMKQVYSQMFLALKPGGYAAIVVKNYVRNRQIVDLCGDTVRLLEHCGFTIVERIHAMLVEQSQHHDLFGGIQTTKRQRKSFFRRIAEANGSPAIDWEEVIFCRKVLTGWAPQR